MKVVSGVRMSFRGNVTLGNDLLPYKYADGAGGRLLNFTNYSAPYMDTSGGLLPALATTNVFPSLSGSFPVGINGYTNIIVDVYELDPEGWATASFLVSPSWRTALTGTLVSPKAGSSWVRFQYPTPVISTSLPRQIPAWSRSRARPRRRG